MARAMPLAVVLLAVSLATAARGDEILFSDSFEGYPPRVPVIGGFGGWAPLHNSFDEPAGNIFTDRQSSDGTISLQQYGSHSGCWASGLYHRVSLPAEFLVEVDMMASGDIDNAQRSVCGANPHDIAVGLYSDFNAWGHGVWLAALKAGGVISGMTSILMDNAVAMRWYRVRMKVDRVAGTIDYWIDGVPRGHSVNPECREWGPTLQYLYFGSGGGKGWVDNVRIYTDNTVPVTTLSLSGVSTENGWFWSDVVATLAASDNGSGVARTEYAFNPEGTWDVYAGPFGVTAKGATTIHYRSVDNRGNVEPAQRADVKIDRVPPVAGSTDPVNSASGVPRDTTIAVSFSEDIVPGDNVRNVKLYKSRIAPGAEVAIKTDTAGAVLFLRPVRKLAPKTVYKVVVPAGAVKDLAGHPLATDLPAWSFKTLR